MMKRREFITLLGGAGAAWPLVAHAQQPAMPVIGFLAPLSRDANAHRLRAFRQGLKDAGYVEGENVLIEYRGAEGQYDQLPAQAADLVRRRVAVIAAFTPAAARAAKAATGSIPIVFAVSADPVSLGLVASLARPGGNLTGINFFVGELVAKRLELLRELLPAATRIAVLVNPTEVTNTALTLKDVETAASAMGLQIKRLNASTSLEINMAFATFVRERPEHRWVASGSRTTSPASPFSLRPTILRGLPASDSRHRAALPVRRACTSVGTWAAVVGLRMSSLPRLQLKQELDFTIFSLRTAFYPVGMQPRKVSSKTTDEALFFDHFLLRTRIR